MKKALFLLLAVVLLVSMAGIASAAIEGSAHDFTSDSGSLYTGNSELCNICHVPHNGIQTSIGPLWNHTPSTVTSWTAYDDPNGTIDALDLDANLSGVSRLCLSCHDGTVAVDSFGTSPTTTVTLASTDSGYVGTDLSDDHPVGFTYDATLVAADSELTAVTAAGTPQANVGTLPLFGKTTNDQMECATCHEPHNNGLGSKLLRIDNAMSALCTTCHTK